MLFTNHLKSPKEISPYGKFTRKGADRKFVMPNLSVETYFEKGGTPLSAPLQPCYKVQGGVRGTSRQSRSLQSRTGKLPWKFHHLHAFLYPPEKVDLVPIGEEPRSGNFIPFLGKKKIESEGALFLEEEEGNKQEKVQIPKENQEGEIQVHAFNLDEFHKVKLSHQKAKEIPKVHVIRFDGENISIPISSGDESDDSEPEGEKEKQSGSGVGKNIRPARVVIKIILSLVLLSLLAEKADSSNHFIPIPNFMAQSSLIYNFKLFFHSFSF